MFIFFMAVLKSLNDVIVLILRSGCWLTTDWDVNGGYLSTLDCRRLENSRISLLTEISKSNIQMGADREKLPWSEYYEENNNNNNNSDV